MPTVYQGTRTTGTGIAAQRLVIEMQDEIYQYDPNKTPTLAILSQSSGSKSGAAVFNHLEDEPRPVWDTLGANLSNASTTSITVTTGTLFRAGDLVLIPTSLAGGKPEVVYVSSVSTNTLTVIRDWVNNNGGTGGTAAVSTDNVLIMSNANEEASGTRAVLTTTEAQITNYCQIIKTPFAVGGTLDATTTYGPPDLTYQRQKAATDHAFDQERAFLFGTKRTTTGASTGRPIRATGGMIYWLSTNSVNAGGTLTHSTMESLAQKCFRYGSGTKVLLVGRTVATQLDNIAEGRLMTVPEADTYGVKMSRYVTAHGEFLVKIHDMLINNYAGYGLVVDMSKVQKRFTVNHEGKRDSLLRTNIQTPDEDVEKDEYLSEIGLHIHQEKAHGLLYGVA